MIDLILIIPVVGDKVHDTAELHVGCGKTAFVGSRDYPPSPSSPSHPDLAVLTPTHPSPLYLPYPSSNQPARGLRPVPEKQQGVRGLHEETVSRHGLKHVDDLADSESMSIARLRSHSGYEYAGKGGKVEVAVVADDCGGVGVGQCGVDRSPKAEVSLAFCL
ncbi:hypothetical protein E2C01_052436 [Portunus trituberculatus]|uniref:Uncharacterized protein n=1 Tax=Portunus trituberculatus TaxID=210409 RepID=A0A5B7GEI9_PORTR|nr:hypothetical protein [Portunus trituberculatus]